jgi:hypothetical protein
METEKSLLNTDIVRQYLSIKWSDSHSAPISLFESITAQHYLGGGMLYYGLVQTQRSKVAVVIGSGAGFVPKLIAHAQRDASVENGYTYWVDADINVVDPISEHEFGQPELDKAVLDRNLFLLRMRSSYASKLFLKENIKIDYLHIDGDHTIKGILEDWYYYQPLLNKNAIVTFHDYSSTPDVKIALNAIQEKNPEIEFVIFPNAGAGIALAQWGGLRIYKENRVQQPSLISFFKNNKNTQTLFMEDVYYIPESGGRNRSEAHWGYLKHPDFLKRYELAQNFLENSESIVEIGGFPNSMVYFLSPLNKKIFAIEPFGANEWAKNMVIESIKKNIELTIYPSVHDLYNLNLKDNYSVVWLGMGFSYYDKKEIRKTLDLLKFSEKSVLETSNYQSSLSLKDFMFTVLNPYVVEERKIIIQTDQTLYKERNMYFIKGFRAKNDSESLDHAIEKWIASQNQS